MSDHLQPDGLEHHESSANRVPEKTFLDPDALDGFMDLLPHEFFHSWNGKYRRPAGLATTNFQEPMKDDLLWVYEGLTHITARCWLRAVDSGLYRSCANRWRRPRRT